MSASCSLDWGIITECKGVGMGVFKAYDIRGIWNQEWGPDLAYKIGRNLPGLLKADIVLVGRDVRLSSDDLFQALTSGIVDAGCDVHDLGLATTPMVYWYTARFGYKASVQITASHNPPDYNGLKISREQALPVGGNSGLKELEALSAKDPGPAVKNKGTIKQIDGKNPYYEFLQSRLPPSNDLNDLKLCVDLSNGMSGLFIPELLPKATFLNQQMDGGFPGHEPNPLEEHNRRQLVQHVKSSNYDAGIIFDGDADRVMFVDENGDFVSPDLMTAIFARPWLERESVPVLVDIRTSRAVEDDVLARGGSIHYWKVGHAFAKLKLRELNAPVGGELAGHYYFRDFYWCDSGIFAALEAIKALIIAKKNGQKFSDLLKPLRSYANSGEINFKVENKSEAISNIQNYWNQIERPESVWDFDGIRMNFQDWWFNIRTSQTEPYLRLVMEAKSEDLLNEKKAQMIEKIQPFLS